VWVGCAGWTLPRETVREFPGPGTHLERYGRVLPAVEINTTFYRPHRPETFERWAASVPAGFRFSLKVPRTITHFRRLRNPDEMLAAFFDASALLRERRGPVVVQLPPTLRYEEGVARGFFETLRRLHRGPVACEPRHPSWFDPPVESMLAELEIARVAADPPRAGVDAQPGGWPGLAYFRLHGSPRMYYSAYDDAFLDALARRVRRLKQAGEVWVIFDNTATRAVADNALSLIGRLV
jgi:uncharacterized protein YecE (DUF72 family)